MQHHKYSLTELEEYVAMGKRNVYVGLLVKHMQSLLNNEEE